MHQVTCNWPSSPRGSRSWSRSRSSRAGESSRPARAARGIGSSRIAPFPDTSKPMIAGRLDWCGPERPSLDLIRCGTGLIHRPADTLRRVLVSGPFSLPFQQKIDYRRWPAEENQYDQYRQAARERLLPSHLLRSGHHRPEIVAAVRTYVRVPCYRPAACNAVPGWRLSRLF
jgi:hypothetical protein